MRKILPWTLLGVGVAVGAVGIGLGVASKNAEDAYGKGAVETQAQINRTVAKREDAENKALAANICFGIAGAAAIAGFATWLLWRDTPQESSKVTVVPQFTRSQAGLSLQGLFGR
jgi:hypothetical protein